MRWPAFLLPLCLFGCARAGVAVDSAAIVNGEVSGPEDDAVVLVTSPNVAICTGTLVAPNLVLTARHCVAATFDEHLVCGIDGRPKNGGTVGASVAASALHVSVGARPKLDPDAYGAQVFVPDTDTLCDSDFALIVLDRKLATAPVASLRRHAPPVVGELIRAVGFGYSNNSTGTGRRARAHVPIEVVGPEDVSIQLDSVGPHELRVGESICQGDSGSPALSEATGAIVGVTARGTNGQVSTPGDLTRGCVDDGVHVTDNTYVRVDGYDAVFDAAFAAAQATPRDEGALDPRAAQVGASCDTGGACPAGICLDVEHDGYCSQPCGGAWGGCPDGSTCEPDGARTVCRLAPRAGCDLSPRAPSGMGLVVLLLLFASCVRAVRSVRRFLSAQSLDGDR